MNDDAACSDVKLADQGRVSKGETLKSETLEFYLLTDLNLDILELEVDLNVLEFIFPSWCWWVEILEYNSVAAEKRCGWFVSVQDGQKWSDGEGEVHSELSTPPTSKQSGQQRVGRCTLNSELLQKLGHEKCCTFVRID